MSTTAKAARLPVYKRCGCGQTYTRKQWAALTSLGVQGHGDDALDLRNCKRCGSTMAIEVEVWRPVPGYEGYEVSNLGAVRSWRVPGHATTRARKPREIAGFRNWDGYHLVPLYRGDGRRPERQQVHRLVLMAFAGACPVGYVAAHLSGDNSDNRRCNLAWVTRAENEAHKKAHGTALVGERHHAAKLSAEQVQVIRERRAAGETLRSIADDYGVSESTISLIGRGRIWATEVAS